MPWRETGPMDERISFVSSYLRAEAPLSALCEAYGISRKTGHKWINRYRTEGAPGLGHRIVMAGGWRRRWLRRYWRCVATGRIGGRASCG